jgi:hypothetical protein
MSPAPPGLNSRIEDRLAPALMDDILRVITEFVQDADRHHRSRRADHQLA